MVWDPQTPKIDPVDPPVDPILAQFVRKKADFGLTKHVFLNFFLLQIIFYRFPDGVGPSKPKIGPLYPPVDPISACSGNFWSTRNPAWSRT